MDEEFIVFIVSLLVVGGTGGFGYMLGKARAAKEYLERHGPTGARLPADANSSQDSEMVRLRAAVEGMVHRFDLMEQRVDFTERLVEAGQRKTIARTDEEWNGR